jgi:hypothetical protein
MVRERDEISPTYSCPTERYMNASRRVQVVHLVSRVNDGYIVSSM